MGYDQEELFEKYNELVGDPSVDIEKLFGKPPYEFLELPGKIVPVYKNCKHAIFVDQSGRRYYHYFKKNPNQLVVLLPMNISEKSSKNFKLFDFPNPNDTIVLTDCTPNGKPLYTSTSRIVASLETFKGRRATALITFHS